MPIHEVIDVLEEIKLLDDSIYVYNPAYMTALETAISTLRKDYDYPEQDDDFHSQQENNTTATESDFSGITEDDEEIEWLILELEVDDDYLQVNKVVEFGIMNIVLGACAGVIIAQGVINKNMLMTIAGLAVFAVAIALVW